MRFLFIVSLSRVANIVIHIAHSSRALSPVTFPRAQHTKNCFIITLQRTFPLLARPKQSFSFHYGEESSFFATLGQSSSSAEFVAVFGCRRGREMDGRQQAAGKQKKRATGEKRKLSISIKDHDQVFIIFLSSYNNGRVAAGLLVCVGWRQWWNGRKLELQHEEKR